MATSVSLTDHARFARALRSRPFALLWTGQTISGIGDGAYLPALAWQVLLLTHSGTAMGAVLTATSLPRLLFLLVGGVTADRLPRRLVLIWSDGGRAVAVFAVAALGAAGRLELGHLIALALLFGVAESFFRPAYQAIPPQLVDVDALPSANALTALSKQGGQLLGPMLGAGMVAVATPASTFAFDGLTFVASALCLLAMRQLPAPAAGPISTATPVRDLNPQRGGLTGVLVDIREGADYVVGSTWLRVIIPVAALRNVGWAGLAVALPKQVHDGFGAGVGVYGAISAASAVGTIAATFLMGQMPRLHHRGLVAHLTLTTSCLALVVYGLPLPHSIAPVLATAAALVFGVGMGVFGLVWVTVLQELVPIDKLGRVSSIDFLGSFVLAPIAYAAAGLATDHFGPGWVLMASGLLNLVLTCGSLLVRAVRSLE